MMNESTIFEYANEAFEYAYNTKLGKNAKQFFASLRDEYGAEEVIKSIVIVVDTYDDEVEAICKLPGVLYNRSKIKNSMFEED